MIEINNELIIVSQASRDYLSIPEEMDGAVTISDDLWNDIKTCIDTKGDGPVMMVIFIHISEYASLYEHLELFSIEDIVYQMVLFGVIGDLSSFSPREMHTISEYRMAFLDTREFIFIVRKTLAVLRQFIKTVELRNEYLSNLIDVRRDQEDLINIGRALSIEKDQESLLRLILFLSKKITGADAGSIYLVEEDDEGKKRLRFKFSNTFLRDIPLEEFVMDINKKSIAGYVAATGQVLNIPDAYAIPPEAPYSFNSAIDRKHDYRCRSMLVVPMKNHVDDIIGVIQLINSKEDLIKNKSSGNEAHTVHLETAEDFYTRVKTFDEKYNSLLEAIAGQAAIAIENNRMVQQIRKQFEEFVRASVEAIESRDPGTSGHSFRVARLCRETALAVNMVDHGYLKDFSFSDSDIRELELAALLHDFGKVYVDLAIFQKAKKLFPRDFDNLLLRIDYLHRTLELGSLSRIIQCFGGDGNDDGRKNMSPFVPNLVKEKNEIIRRISAIREKLMRLNEPAITDEDPDDMLKGILGEIKNMECLDIDGKRLDVISESDIVNLAVKRGSLNPSERKEIESHVMHTYNFVRSIPWPPEYRRIPEIALGHHEKIDGSGYPYGLKGRESISIQSRIMVIADMFDALSAGDRTYKKAVPLERILEILDEEADAVKLDRDLVDVFLNNRIYEKVLKQEVL